MTSNPRLIALSQEEANERISKSRPQGPVAAIGRLLDLRAITQDEFDEVINGHPMPETLRLKIEQEIRKSAEVMKALDELEKEAEQSNVAPTGGIK